ncbi:undecaprenyl-diphosphatase [Georgenia soli]|uniref:Undecaprenyl-diphosphatase n=1 Tax=Georgenia soli TaxID=638953 RepID=A0A2A9EJE4_9MICO|nr:phosphatase PAP2 family protein [Georgenia soli]PFG39064.1 undecaprenyl-diphosphatase [Georgenia soli]
MSEGSPGRRGPAAPSAVRLAFPRRSPWRSALLLLGWAVLLLTAATGVGLLIGSGVSPTDRAVVAWAASVRTAPLTSGMTTLTELGSMRTLGPLLAVAAAWLVIRRRPAWTVAACAAAVGIVVLVDTTKLLVGRVRPSLGPVLDVVSPSFPSGHAAQSAAVLVVLAVVLTGHGSARAAAPAVAVVLVVGVGVTRVYLGVHYPSDVLAGWLLGALWAAVVLRVVAQPGPESGDGPARAVGRASAAG